jgi:hypothetical protein
VVKFAEEKQEESYDVSGIEDTTSLSHENKVVHGQKVEHFWWLKEA